MMVWGGFHFGCVLRQWAPESGMMLSRGPWTVALMQVTQQRLKAGTSRQAVTVEEQGPTDKRTNHLLFPAAWVVVTPAFSYFRFCLNAQMRERGLVI